MDDASSGVRLPLQYLISLDYDMEKAPGFSGMSNLNKMGLVALLFCNLFGAIDDIFHGGEQRRWLVYGSGDRRVDTVDAMGVVDRLVETRSSSER